MVPIFDVVVDLQYGDSGKGKVAHFWLEVRNILIYYDTMVEVMQGILFIIRV